MLNLLSMNVFERKNSLLGIEFDRYVMEHTEFRERIPDNAHVILLIDGDEEFNEWSNQVGRKQAEDGQPIIFITIKKLGQIHSRIKELEMVAK